MCNLYKDLCIQSHSDIFQQNDIFYQSGRCHFHSGTICLCWIYHGLMFPFLLLLNVSFLQILIPLLFIIMEPSVLKEGILYHLDYPVVFSSMVDTWSCSRWSLEDWASFFGDKALSLRVGKQDEDVSCFHISCIQEHPLFFQTQNVTRYYMYLLHGNFKFSITLPFSMEQFGFLRHLIVCMSETIRLIIYFNDASLKLIPTFLHRLL